MYTTQFNAGFAYASKEADNEYFIVGLSESEFDYEQYILFQKSYEEGDAGDVFIECNGDQCVNCVTEISIDNNNLTLFVKDTRIIIAIEGIMLPKHFIEYLTEIFGLLLKNEHTN